MNDGFEGPRISPAEVLLERPKMDPPLVKRAARPPEPTASGPPFINPGFLNVAAILGIVTGNYMRLPVATAVLHPCKEAALFGVLASNVGEGCLDLDA